MSTVQTRPSWFRQQREPVAAYEAFKLFRGTLERGDEDTPLMSHGNTKNKKVDIDSWKPSQPVRDLQLVSRFTKKSYDTIAQYSSKYKWKDRAFDYDTYVSERIKESIDANINLKVSKFLKIRDEEAERLMRLSHILQSKVEAMASQANLWQYTDEIEETYPDGRPMTVRRTYRPVGWRLRDIALMSKHSMLLMQNALRLALGEPAGGEQGDGDDMVPADLAAAAYLAIEKKAEELRAMQDDEAQELRNGDGPA